ncbi:hypothetical protein BFW01_g11029 [Lasiodiplodia theobromae]|nr:hypothetical protein BFW01_g11029 [Lasiodiplodia theobromae]
MTSRAHLVSIANAFIARTAKGGLIGTSFETSLRERSAWSGTPEVSKIRFEIFISPSHEVHKTCKPPHMLAELALKDDRLNGFELDLQDRRRQLVEYQSESAKDREMITKMKQFLSDFIHGNVEDVLDSLEECEEVLDALGEEK